jgi:REP element-mobilizing transposase RayT
MYVTRPTRCFHLIGHPSSSSHHFARTADYRRFISLLRDALSPRAVRLLSYAILPNRWHLVVGAEDPFAALELMARVVKTHTSRARGSVGPDDQVGIEQLRSGAMVVTRCRDVEREALDLGLVSRAQDWPWCSAAERFLMLNRLPLAASPFLVSAMWLDYLNDTPRQPLAGHRSLRHFAEVPGRLARLPQGLEQRVSIPRRRHQNHAHTHVEGTEHLGLGHASGLP